MPPCECLQNVGKPRRSRQGAALSHGSRPADGIKVTAETAERFYKAADTHSVASGELLRFALEALEGQGARVSRVGLRRIGPIISVHHAAINLAACGE